MIACTKRAFEEEGELEFPHVKFSLTMAHTVTPATVTKIAVAVANSAPSNNVPSQPPSSASNAPAPGR